MIALAVLLLGELQVVAEPGCVTRESIATALDEGGGIAEVERVAVHVSPGTPDDAGRARRAVDIDILLLGVDPLHRQLVIRPHECRELPELVALLVKEQRRAPAPPPLPPLVPDLKTRPAPADDGRRDVKWGACDGPPDCNGDALALQVGALLLVTFDGYQSLMFGWRHAGEYELHLSDDNGLVLGVEAHGSSTTIPVRLGVAGEGGVAHHVRLGPLDLALRGLVGVGLWRESSGALQPFVMPSSAARLRWGWVYVEAGAVLRATLQSMPAPGLYLAFGFHA